jgi:UDP-3-O-[3-hydroxymyristoyl] glucosamine N-acyltransferase
MKNEKGIKEILTMDEALKEGIIELGKNVKIKEGTVIGTDGFGFERNEVNELEKFPHYGKVIIGDNVDIGANCTIDRGNMENTIIKSGTKIDNGVHIAHNVLIGKNCIIGPHVVILGSAKIGDNSTIWTNSVIKEHMNLGNNVIIGACSYINLDIPENSTAYGIPGKISEKR